MYSLKKLSAAFIIFILSNLFIIPVYAQLRLPDGGVNYKCSIGRTVGVTDIYFNWNAPGVKGREGKIWGSPVAPYGFEVLGFGSSNPSPWRAGANESTTISFSTDVMINGKPLAAGTYGFFIALYSDSSTLIFNKNTKGWGSYFYDSSLDVMRVRAIQQKDLKESKERLEYTFSDQTDHSVELALEWERWRIPFTVTTDLLKNTLASVRAQMSGALAFDTKSLEAASAWSLQNNTNYEQALNWINSALDPNLGAVKSFNAVSVKAGLLEKLGRKKEADSLINVAMETATAFELHGYGRRLLSEKRFEEAMKVFKKNFNKYKGVWPTNVGMMRGYSAIGDFKNALKHAKLAVTQAPDDLNRNSLEQAIQKLSEGKAL